MRVRRGKQKKEGKRIVEERRENGDGGERRFKQRRKCAGRGEGGGD